MIMSVLLIGSVAVFRYPNDTVDSRVVRVVCTDPKASTLPAPPAYTPACTTPPSPSLKSALAEFTTADFTCAGDADGFFCLNSAAAPAAIAAAKLVPWFAV